MEPMPGSRAPVMRIASYTPLIGFLLLVAGLTTAVWTISAFQSVMGMTFAEEEKWDGRVEIDWMRFDVIHHDFLLIVAAFLMASVVALVLGVVLVRPHLRSDDPTL
jgi:hypothetical protein